jgi:hypothetical protein
MFDVRPRSLAQLACALAIFACGGGSHAPATASESGSAGTPAAFPPRLYADAIGQGDASRWVFAAFSQVATDGSDPQALELAPDVVPRAWAQWDLSGTRPGDYDFGYVRRCQAKGVTFIGGLTASVIFRDQMSAADFDDEVGRDAQNNPVPRDEIVAGAFRGSLASPGYRRRLIDIAKLQIDGGVDGLFFDEVNSGYTGARYNGNEGFDDHHVADFGRYLCVQYGSDTSRLARLDLAPEDSLDCGGADPGATFDYRGYLARHHAASAPLSSLNPLAGEWGTTVQNRPDPAKGTFVDIVEPLVYWQDIVRQVRAYAREKYQKEILITGAARIRLRACGRWPL